MITFRAVSHGTHRGPMTQQEYVQRMAEIQRAAVSTSRMGPKTAAFWRMEYLSSEFLKHRREGQSLRDPDLPISVRPISHCGMGIAAVEEGDFEPARIAGLIESFSDPAYRLFAYEGLGAMLALYEPDLFGAVSRFAGRIGLLPLAPLRRPDTVRFLTCFDQEIRRLIAHGYGRLQYLKNHTISSAIRAVARTPELGVTDGVQGIAFAYAMVNNGDLGRVFQAGEEIRDTVTAEAFADGLTYALEFWEWMAPGFLGQFEARTEYQKSLARRAAEEVAKDRACGPMVAFAVGPQRKAQSGC